MSGVTSLRDNAAILDEIEADWTPYALRLEEMRKVCDLFLFSIMKHISYPIYCLIEPLRQDDYQWQS